MSYEIQQDNANYYRVIHTADDGSRRAVDHPPCRTPLNARRLIAQLEGRCDVCGYTRPSPPNDDDRVIAFGVCEDCSRDEHEADEHDYPDRD